mgnify:CR=1 FL=1
MPELSKTNEQAFEWLIERALTGTTLEERGANADVETQVPSGAGYYWGKPKDFDPKLAIDMRRLWSFLETTQKDILERIPNYREAIPKQIARNIEKMGGIIDVLRNGVDVFPEHITMFYPKPTASDSEQSKVNYQKNQWSITRQQTYSFRNPGNEIDMVIYVNGLPIITMELKNPWTHQTARYNGIKQYEEDRDPRDPLLNYGRCLVHFTVDKNEIFMATRLEKKKTYFMPYNKGLPEGQGAGNPPVEQGYKTAYLWKEVLQPDTLADIIGNYVLFDYGEAKTEKKVPHIMSNAKKLIFPRYHQLRVVTDLLDDVATKGVGDKYLIEHSAGSGKSNSITWLAYLLMGVTPKTMETNRAKALDSKLFDTILVVTDRRLLDKQIAGNLKAFGQSKETFAQAGSAKELKELIEDGKKIISTTIQKFPYMCSAIADMSGNNFAVIIDEAHSSQSGIAADKLNATTYKVEDEDDEDTKGGDIDALIEQLMKERKLSPNTSYFAFTATPKRETLERFGRKGEDGKFRPFHLYSMKQAIEEGFILNVIANYTTYKSYYEIAKSIKENPKFDSARAQKALKAFVEQNEETIKHKAEVMFRHFDAQVFRKNLLSGKGKAMIVTQNIPCAIIYFQKIQELIREYRVPYKAVIAFSGSKKVNGLEYTEAGMNDFPETETAEQFENEENRILVVANKYLTGFDQPKLCAMYIDKRLNGVLAVQALSRLNRAAPELGKRTEDLFVLDFFNSTDDMKTSFDPYFTGTVLEEATDVNILSNLRRTLLDMEVFSEQEVQDFMALYITGAEADQLAPIIDKAAHRFNVEYGWDNDTKIDFKMKCKQFVRIYSRMAAIIPFEMKDWEMLYWYIKLLIPELKVKTVKDDLKDLLDSVDLSTYGLRRTQLSKNIELDAATSEIKPTSATMVNGGEGEPQTDPLDKIIEDFNKKWFDGWKNTPEEQKVKLTAIAKAIAEDQTYKERIVGNQDVAAADILFSQLLNAYMVKKRKDDMSLYNQFRHNTAFAEDFTQLIRRTIDNADFLIKF